MSVNELVINYPKVIVFKFNDFVSNVGPTLASKIQPVSTTVSISDTLLNPNSDSMSIVPCTISEVVDTINKLQYYKGTGLDGFLTSVVKSVSNHIAKQLTHIFNLSFTSGVFPGKLKLTNVTPIFKSNAKLTVNNYRPISLLPVFSKVLEKLMHKRLMSFFVDKCNLLTEYYYGCREKHSTYMTLSNIIDQISESLDVKKYSIGIFLDLSKAFDTIDHRILLPKLQICGLAHIHEV